MITSAFLSQRNVFRLNNMSGSDLKTVIYPSQIYVCVTPEDSPVVIKSSTETTGRQLPFLALHTQGLTDCRFRGTMTSKLGEFWELPVLGPSF